MLRKIALSLLMLVSLIVMLPLVNSTAHSIKYEAVQNHRRFRHHSRAWWRRHRALMRRRRAARLRRRAMAAAMREYNSLREPNAWQPASVASENHAAFQTTISLPPALLRDANGTVAVALPDGWSAGPLSKTGEARFRVSELNGNSAGQAALSVVAASSPSQGRMSLREQHRALAGVSYPDLRRTVIDKMITSGGWVVNDMERDLDGRKVFVVVAQTPASNDGKGPEQIWNFYFTEVNGRVYSLATSAPRQSSNRVASGAEKFITSLPAASHAGPTISIR
ncbi:MAG: hypothetical protein ABI923_01205 [bacterium]